MKKFVLSAITTAVLSTSVLASEVPSTPSILPVNQMTEISQNKLDTLKKLVVDAGGSFQVITENGVFKSLHIKKHRLNITIKDDSTIILSTEGENKQKITSSLNHIIEEFIRTIEKETKA